MRTGHFIRKHPWQNSSYLGVIKDLHLLYYTIFNTEFGWVAIAGSAEGLSRITLPQTNREKASDYIAGLLPQAVADRSFFGNLIPRLQGYFKGERVDFPDALDLRGCTTFQGNVWALTRAIPYGETRTYGWIAKEIGFPRAGRAVGRALARNPFPIVVPCHRVVGGDGSMVGFSNGLEMKRKLLALEASFISI
ncbi:MAG: Methylated-DNA--protein-cysteine methyltransferase [Dehalococcoidia bacterium]|nr:Methylated-DNA--protein-cysteine methyltransferase [Chloroflexota bacterium]